MPDVPIDTLRCRVTWRKHAYKIDEGYCPRIRGSSRAPPGVRRDLLLSSGWDGPVDWDAGRSLGTTGSSQPQRRGLKYNNKPAVEALCETGP
jgi:hypothetical protein